MNTKALRQKILDLAIHGKLVPQDPNDEPASVLLERIKAEKEHLIKEGKIKRAKRSKAACDKPHYPFELPEGWCWTTLGEISNYGTTVNIQVENIEENEWILELEDVEKETANIIQRLSKGERSVKGTRHKFNAGDILYSKLRTYLNKVLVAPNEGYCTTEIMPLNTYGIMSNEYICHVLRSPFFLGYTLQCGYGVKMPRLSTTDACNGIIPLPPLKEQLRIVEEIKRWFALIDIIESGKGNLQTTIKQTKSKILDLAIHGKLVPQDPMDEPASELLKRINPKAEIACDNAHYPFEVPKGWVWCKLKDCCHIAGRIGFRGYTKEDLVEERKGAITFSPSNIIDGDMNYGKCTYISWEKYEESPEIKVLNGDILLVKTGSSFGKCALVKELPWKSTINPQFVVLKFILIDAQYLTWVLQSTYARKNYDNFVLGSAIPTFTQVVLGDMSIPLPPLNEQYRIVAKIKELFFQLDDIASAL